VHFYLAKRRVAHIVMVLSISYADIRRGVQMRVRSSKMRPFSVDRCIFRMKFPTDFTYRKLNGLARFPGDSTDLVLDEQCERRNVIR